VTYIFNTYIGKMKGIEHIPVTLVEVNEVVMAARKSVITWYTGGSLRRAVCWHLDLPRCVTVVSCFGFHLERDQHMQA
jgi:hypothetical protein